MNGEPNTNSHIFAIDNLQFQICNWLNLVFYWSSVNVVCFY